MLCGCLWRVIDALLSSRRFSHNIVFTNLIRHRLVHARVLLLVHLVLHRQRFIGALVHPRLIHAWVVTSASHTRKRQRLIHGLIQSDSDIGVAVMHLLEGTCLGVVVGQKASWGWSASAVWLMEGSRIWRYHIHSYPLIQVLVWRLYTTIRGRHQLQIVRDDSAVRLIAGTTVYSFLKVGCGTD